MIPIARLRRKKFLFLLVAVTCLGLTIGRPIIDGACYYAMFAGSQICLQRFEYGHSAWDLFYHLGGNGPWIPKANVVQYEDEMLPEGCSITQAHMLSRHGERYPTNTTGRRHIQLLNSLRDPGVTLSGPMAFAKTWEYFADTDEKFDNLVREPGVYAATARAHHTGQKLRQRYDHLVRTGRPTKFWSCGSGRDVETASNFGDGFFGGLAWREDPRIALLQIIPETQELGANTLTPGETCVQYKADKEEGHRRGIHKLKEWQKVFTKPIAERLKAEIQGYSPDATDIYAMMEMCGFQILVNGSSPWCDVFTEDEWLDYEYGRDLLHFYRAGPGNPYAAAMGVLWLNATQTLMGEYYSNDVYFSFVHDGDIIPMLAALQLLNERTMAQTLPTDRRKDDRHWVTSDIQPMSGRINFERITCTGKGHGNDFSSEEDTIRQYVRLSINDGFIKMPGLIPAEEVPHAVWLDDFQDCILLRTEQYGKFSEVCNISESLPDRITFLNQNTNLWS